MKKLLMHLTNAPIAVALAFLLVGAPSAPMAKMMPSSGDAFASCEMSHGEYIRAIENIRAMSGGGIYGDYGPAFVDTDCDGIPDHVDECPNDASNTCNDGGGWWSSITLQQCLGWQDIDERIAGTLGSAAAIAAYLGSPLAAPLAAFAGLTYIDAQLGRIACHLIF